MSMDLLDEYTVVNLPTHLNQLYIYTHVCTISKYCMGNHFVYVISK